jgi:glycosyltransferase involved in cell wall biosynthesis
MTVSFVIPVKNDASGLERCLLSIGRLERAGADLEVLVIDNGSIDDTPAVATRWGARVLSIPNQCVSALRNTGVRQARGELLAFVDADHELSHAWLSAALETLESSPDIGAVGALYSPPESPTWVQRVYDALRGHVPGRKEVEWLASGNLCVRRAAFEAISGFDTTLEACEDVDFCHRLRAAGWRLLSDDRLHSVHFGDPPTIRKLFRSELWRGRDNLRVSLRPPRSFRSVVSALIPAVELVALGLVAVGLVAAPFGYMWPLAAGLTVVMVLALLRTRRILRHLRPPAAGDLLRAFSVALVYDAARALALVLRTRHRRSHLVVPPATSVAPLTQQPGQSHHDK